MKPKSAKSNAAYLEEHAVFKVPQADDALLCRRVELGPPNVFSGSTR
jgi:hypothetical protein